MGVEQIAQWGGLVVVMATLIGMVVKATRDFERDKQKLEKDFDSKLNEVREHDAKKRAEVYKRIEQSERESEQRYVRKDMCDLTTQQVHGTLQEVSRDLKQMMTGGGNS